MANDGALRKALAVQLLTLFPPVVRADIANDPDFRDHYGVSLDATITFPAQQVAVRRSVLHAAIRELYNHGKTSVSIAATDGQTVQLSIEVGLKPLIFMTVEHIRLQAPTFWMLADDPAIRLVNFEDEVGGLNLPADLIDSWRARIEKASLNDDEIEEFIAVVKSTPEQVEDAIRSELQKPEGSASVLVPNNPAYFQGLIGRRDKAANVGEYVDGSARHQIKRLLKWDFKRGLAQCLLFCANSQLSALIDIADRDEDEVQEFFEWLVENGDRFSQIAGVEVGIRSIAFFPRLEPLLVGFLEEIRDEDTSDDAGRSALTMNLFVFVDGELARTRIFANEPPYWRRLAAISHASVIERVIIENDGERGDTSELLRLRSEQFFMQTLADLRQEPRWPPDLMNVAQLRLEFLMRARIAGQEMKDVIVAGPLHAMLLGEEDNQLGALTSIPSAYAPGPVEGGMNAPLPFPEDMLEDLRKSDKDDVVEVRIFAGIVNFSMVFRFDDEIAGLIADLLRKVKYRLSLDPDSEIGFTLIMGLAMVAASARHVGLADEVRILSRVLMRRGELTSDAENQMRVALLACASRVDIQDWCKAVADWLLEIAGGELDRQEAIRLRSHLRRLCFSAPELWEHVSKVDANLAAIAG